MNNSSTDPPSILVHIETSSPVLSKYDNPAFTILLEAHVDDDQPPVMDPFFTVLNPLSTGLNNQLSFRDTETGQAARARVVDPCFAPPEVITAASNGLLAEIPAKGATHAYKVSHTLHISRSPTVTFPERPDLERTVNHDVEYETRNQAGGFVLGRTYGIGSSTEINTASWWKKGNRAEVLALVRSQTGLPLGMRADGTSIRLVLVNAVSLQVVE